ATFGTSILATCNSRPRARLAKPNNHRHAALRPTKLPPVADFDPRQLDQLEDALEGLEDIDDLESLELSPALTERLAEYQDVLALCREAFPVEEPHADLLADVLAEAQAVSRRVKPSQVDESPWRRFWTRWRGTLVPGLALAGTAAAVLLLLEPKTEHAKLATDDASRRASADDSDSAPS